MAGIGRSLLALSTRRVGTTTQLDVRGEVDIDSAPELEAAIRTALEDPPEHLVIDLQQVAFLDSTAMAVLIAAAARTQHEQVGLVVLRPSGPAGRIFALCGVEGLFPEAGTRRRRHPAGDGSAEPPGYLTDWAF